jgi:hypothetical protein
MDPGGPRIAVADRGGAGLAISLREIVALAVPLLRFTGALAAISEEIEAEIVSTGHYRTMLFA